MNRCVVTLVATAGAFALAPSAAAAPVPIGECLFCAMPNPLSFPDPNDPRQNPPGCFHRRLWCDRTDGAPYEISAGTPGVVTGATLSCRNCSNCPDCPPPPMLCTQALEVCFNETVSFEIQIGGEAGEAIKGSLAAAIGISASTQVCATMTCGSENIAPCTWASYAAKMNVRNGIVYGLDSRFTAGGKISAHFRRRCSIDGTAWSQDCGVKTSKATGSKAFNSFCETTGNGGC
jgi:hypothetical protein